MAITEQDHPSGPGAALLILVAKLDGSSDIWINFDNGTKAVLYHDSGDWMLEGDRFIRASGTGLTVTDGPDIEISLESDRTPMTARFRFPASAVRSIYRSTDLEGMVAVFRA